MKVTSKIKKKINNLGMSIKFDVPNYIFENKTELINRTISKTKPDSYRYKMCKIAEVRNEKFRFLFYSYVVDIYSKDKLYIAEFVIDKNDLVYFEDIREAKTVDDYIQRISDIELSEYIVELKPNQARYTLPIAKLNAYREIIGFKISLSKETENQYFSNEGIEDIYFQNSDIISDILMSLQYRNKITGDKDVLHIQLNSGIFININSLFVHDTVNYNHRFIYCTRKLSSFAENIPDVLNQSLQFMISIYPEKYNISTFIVDNN